MNWYDVISLATEEWYKEGYQPDTVVMHPKDYSELIRQLGEMGGIPPLPTVDVGVNPRTQIFVSCGGLQVKISAQEVEGEFLLVDSKTHEHKRFTLLEEGDGHQLIIDQPRVLAVKNTQLFLVRSHRGVALQHPGLGDYEPRWSERLLKQVSEEYDIVIIFYDLFRVASGHACWPHILIREVIEDLGLQNIGISTFKSSDRLEAIQVWKSRIMEVGGKIKKVNNINDINCFSIPGLTQGRHIFWCDGDGNEKLGILPEKLKSFMDLAKSRESRSNW
jgi:hypothetical protein